MRKSGNLLNPGNLVEITYIEIWKSVRTYGLLEISYKRHNGGVGPLCADHVRFDPCHP